MTQAAEILNLLGYIFIVLGFVVAWISLSRAEGKLEHDRSRLIELEEQAEAQPLVTRSAWLDEQIKQEGLESTTWNDIGVYRQTTRLAIIREMKPTASVGALLAVLGGVLGLVGAALAIAA